MKKIFFSAVCIALTQYTFAQEPADALRYSWIQSSGTARQQSVGGAGASLGGEISSMFINPAGLGFYKTGDFVVSPGLHFLNNKATYFGRTEKDKKNNFVLGTTGIVLGGETNRRKKKSMAVGLAVNRIADFNSRILYRGINNQSSYSQKFLEEIQNNGVTRPIQFDNFPNFAYGTSLAFDTYWIDTIQGATPQEIAGFRTKAPIATGLIQEQVIETKGGITEIALALAGNTSDKLYIGGTLGVPILRYIRESTFNEADATDNPNNQFDFASYGESLKTTGAGLNLKVGIIYKPKEHIRLGLAIHSPSLMVLTDKYHAAITTNSEGLAGTLTQTSEALTGADQGIFKYQLFTPYRVMLGASYVLREIEDVRKQKGFITADIEYVNYKSSSFHSASEDEAEVESTKSYFKELNNVIDKAYKGVFNFRVGGELKFTTVMVRLGGAYFGNPYKDIAGEKGRRFQLTGGLGYRNKGIFIDVAYVHTMGKDVHYAYRLQNAAFPHATIKNTGGNAVLTVGFKI